MPNPNPMKVQMPYSLKAMRALSFHNDPKDIAAHQRLLTRDYYSYREEFDNVTIANSAFWTTAVAGAGAAAAVKAIVATVGPVAQFVTGGAPGSSNMQGAAILPSTNNPFMYVRWQVPSSIVNFGMEIGFYDVVTVATTASVSDIDVVTLANGFANGGTLAWDSAQTLVTPALVGVGTSSPVAKTNIATAAGVWTPTANKWVDLYIGCRVGQTVCEIYENDVFIGQFNTVGPDTATMLIPRILFRDTGATTHTVNVEVVEIMMERNGR